MLPNIANWVNLIEKFRGKIITLEKFKSGYNYIFNF